VIRRTLSVEIEINLSPGASILSKTHEKCWRLERNQIAYAVHVNAFSVQHDEGDSMKYFVSVAIFAASTFNAIAADLPSRVPAPAPAPVVAQSYNWSGF
jgi:hypothetical protein